MATVGYGCFERFSVILFVYFGYIAIINGYLQEYCNTEIFSPTCGQNEVIVMKTALYGRMQRGRCVKSDLGLGCHIDVLPTLDEKCSNKQTCEFNFHFEFDSLETPCPAEIYKYLEADYSCEPVFQLQPSRCRSTSTKIEVTSKLAISSETLTSASCGSSSITFTARPGQQLNLSITDFTFTNHQDNRQSCVNYLELMDDHSENPKPVCAGQYDRSGHVMLTSGPEVKAVFHVQDPRNQRFIISLEAVGCGDITPQDGTWIQRDGDITTLGCQSGRHSWTLECIDNQWVGAVGSCGTGFVLSKVTEQPRTKQWNVAIGMIIFAIFSVLLLLCSTSFTIGVCIFTKTHKNSTKQQALPYHQHTCTLPLIAHNRQNLQTRIPINQEMLNQQQILPREQNQNDRTGVAGIELSKSKTRNVDSDQMYCNTMQSQSDSIYSDSVKYYVLENLQEPKA